MTGDEPHDVDLLTAALRADTTDLDIYARVLADSLADALPAQVVAIERDRSLADRLAGRPGKVREIRISLGDRSLALRCGPDGVPLGYLQQRVRGVVISSRELPIDDWVRSLAEALAEQARQSSTARAALQRLLGSDSG